MAIKRHPADDAAEQQMIAAIRSADHFMASLFRGIGHYQKATATTVRAALREARRLEANSRTTQRCMIYAVGKDGRATFLTQVLIDRLLKLQNNKGRPKITLTEIAMQIEGVAAKRTTPVSRSFSDRSNCRRAMLKFAQEHTLTPDDFKIVKHSDNDFRFHRIGEKNEDGIPPALKLSPEQRSAAWANHQPRVIAPAPAQEITIMARNNNATTKVASRKPITEKKPEAARTGARSRYDWNAAEEMAIKGKVPPALDFSAPTHARFRDALAEVVKAAKAGDEKALKAIKINPVSSSPKALDRYRGLCLKAVKAKAVA